MHCDLILTFNLLTPKSIGHMCNSREVFLLSIMMLAVMGKQLWDINHFQESMYCELKLDF